MSRRTIAITILTAGAAVLTLGACSDGDDDGAPVEAVADAADDAAAGDTAVEFGLVSPETAAELAQDDAITVIDVRTPDEYAAGHIAGATLIDFYEPTFADEIAALDRDGTYLVYCRSDNRSGQAVSLMADLGFEQVYDMDGGMVAYEAAGLPVEG